MVSMSLTVPFGWNYVEFDVDSDGRPIAVRDPLCGQSAGEVAEGRDVTVDFGVGVGDR